jgi:hypothetical protein
VTVDRFEHGKTYRHVQADVTIRVEYQGAASYPSGTAWVGCWWQDSPQLGVYRLRFDEWSEL